MFTKTISTNLHSLGDRASGDIEQVIFNKIFFNIWSNHIELIIF